MPFELLIPVTPSSSGWSPELDDQRGMHAILLGALTHSDAALAERVHDAPVNPFTQALLGGQSEADPLMWRITLLDDGLYEPLVGGLFATTPDRVQDRALTLDLGGMRSSHQTYDALHSEPVMHKHAMRFCTPTTFNKQYYHAPIPEPILCWQSWWMRWQAFAPPRLAINSAVLDVVAAHVVVSRFRIESRVVSNARWHLIGAVGQMTFAAIERDRLDAAWWQAVTTLAAYSLYCGSGHKTAFGLGQTRRQLADDTPNTPLGTL